MCPQRLLQLEEMLALLVSIEKLKALKPALTML